MAAIQTNPYNDPNYLGGGYYFGTGNDQLPGGGGLNTIGNGGNLFDPGGVDLFGNVQGMSDDDLLSMFGFDQGADVPENPDSWWNESMWGSFNPDPGSGGNNGTNPGGGNGAGSGTGSSGAGAGGASGSTGWSGSQYINPGYSAQRPSAPYWDVTNTDPNTELGQNRLASYAWMHGMDQSLTDEANYNQQLGRYLLSDIFASPRGLGTLIAGNTGYVDPSVTGQGSEWNDIVQEGMLKSGMANDDELNNLQLQDWERTKIEGDPYGAFDMIRPMTEGLQGNADELGKRLRETYTQLGDRLDSAIDPTLLGVDPNYEKDQKGIIQGTEDPFNTINNRDVLGLSDEYNQNYQFGRPDIDLLKDKAARYVQASTAAANDQMMREAAGRGNTSALALNDARRENDLYGNISAADAVTDADIAGRKVALDVAGNREATRLGTEQDLANRAYGYLMDVMNAGLGVGQDTENKRISTEQDIATRKAQAAKDWAGMKYAGESDTAKLNDSVGRYNIDTLGAYRANADKAASDRAVTNTNLRTAGQQAALNTRFGQAYQGAGQLSNQYKSIYDQKKAEEAEARSGLMSLYTQANDQNRAAMQQRIGTAGTGFPIANQASSGRKDTASIWDKVLQGINAAGGIAAGFAGA